jgi:hypothetical protein
MHGTVWCTSMSKMVPEQMKSNAFSKRDFNASFSMKIEVLELRWPTSFQNNSSTFKQ